MRAKQSVWQILSYSDIDYLHRRQESQAELFCDIKKALLQRNRRLYETGSGLIYGITDRFTTSYTEKGRQAPKNLTSVIAIIFLLIGVIVAQFGLTGLIAKGYGTCAWLMFITYCIPMVTYGVYKIIRKKNELKLEEPAAPDAP